MDPDRLAVAEEEEDLPPPDLRLPVAVLSALSFGQAAVLLLSQAGMAGKIVGVALAVGGVFASLPVLSVFALIIVVNFTVHLASVEPPLPYRVAQLAILALYGAVAVSAMIALFSRVRFAKAFAASATLVAVLVVTEASIESFVPRSIASLETVSWVGEPLVDPSLGRVYAPYSVLRSRYPDDPRGYLSAGDRSADDAAGSRLDVTYSFNALGCRGYDYAIPRPASTRRIVLLGGGSVLGVGVHQPDTVAKRLQDSLNAGSPALRRDYTYDVINCGVEGTGVRERRLLFEQILYKYQPDVVVIAVTAEDVPRIGSVEPSGRARPSLAEALLVSARVVAHAREQARRQPDYQGVAEEVATTAEACRSRGAAPVVMLWGTTAVTPDFDEMTRAVTSRLEAAQVPVLDLNVALQKAAAGSTLTVHPLDGHLNEVAHRVASEELERFMAGRQMID